ncbi:uncharacterized protein VDAG_02270 [Verticillium dahliae VdLs.17]|uniref:Uncharacterized protein n=1 Tax=Verticillium dahliae (strain VdLs.17 / ATCC MYA-4575 / FGSC 10137) TaxID=498257 RepID=G2WVC9_VERDV|nr:uncharacterized protein VDAG_02270 [Verticillium dahliae VdLs.17]EGY20254.1 hypothetical protein VDAG_02270 [Verticillium dahliae VdLs.17]
MSIAPRRREEKLRLGLLSRPLSTDTCTRTDPGNPSERRRGRTGLVVYSASYEARFVFAKNAQRTSRTSLLFQLEDEATRATATPRSCGVRGSSEGGENAEGQC